MVTMEGEEIDDLYLAPGESAILTYKSRIDSNYTVHPEMRKLKTVRLGGYFYGGWEDGDHLSEQQLKWIQRHLDVLSLNLYIPGKDGKIIAPQDIKAFKQKNSRFKFFNMVYGTTMFEPLFDPERMSDWVLKYIDGREVLGLRRKSEDSKVHVMDLGNAEYADFFRDYLIDHTQKYHADGVAIDEIMWEGYWGIDLKDISGYSSKEEFYRASLNFLKRINKNNSAEIIHQAFWDEAQLYSDGVWGEYAIKYTYTRDENPVFYKKMTYSKIIENMNKIGLAENSYIMAAWYRRSNLQDFKYVLSTYLIGKSGNSIVFQMQPVYEEGYPKNLAGYNIATYQEEFESNRKYLDVELGNPVSPPYQIQGVWARDYQKGMVFCYPR